MNMKFKFVACMLMSTCLLGTAQTSNEKQIALEAAVQRLVQLSQFISSIQADQAESIADIAAFSETDSYRSQLNQINELMDVRDTMSVLINRLSVIDASAVAPISETKTRVEIAYAIGEQIFAGDSLTVVLADIETIDELPDLLSPSSGDVKIIEESMDIMPSEIDPQLADTEDSGEGLSEIPNIYDAIGQPAVYREVMKNLHDDFRESTTTPDGGGFSETSKDATPI